MSVLQLIHHFLKYDDWYPFIWDLLIQQIKYILHDFSQVLRLQESRRLRTLAKQRAKKVVSDSPGLVDFAIGLVNSVFNLPDGQVMFYEEFE